MTLASMKMMLNMTSFARYDFMYLHIDSNNKCNVGYAFVNFAHPMDIITFAEAGVGRKETESLPLRQGLRNFLRK